MALSKILVLLEQNPSSSPAINRALALARASGAEVNLCLFVHHTAIDAIEHLNAGVARLAREALMAEAQRKLNPVLRQLKEAGVKVGAELVWDRLFRSRMLEKIGQQKPDLVIKDIHLESLPRRLLLTPLDWHLLRDSPADLMLVNSESAPLPGRVIAAVEPISPDHNAGNLNERIVETSRAIAKLAPCDVELANCFEGLPQLVADDPLGYSTAYTQLYEQTLEINRKRFSDFAESQKIPSDRRHALFGPAWMALADIANEPKRDLLVLGRVPRGRLDRRLLGSTAERILDSAHCDLLVVRPIEAVDEVQ